MSEQTYQGTSHAIRDAIERLIPKWPEVLEMEQLTSLMNIPEFAAGIVEMQPSYAQVSWALNRVQYLHGTGEHSSRRPIILVSCNTEECKRFKLTTNSITVGKTAEWRAAAELLIESLGQGSEEDADICPGCGKIGTAELKE